MNKYLVFLVLPCLSFGVKAQYTPMNAFGYQYKYTKHDSGFNLPFKDTLIGRGTTRPGAVVCSIRDSLLYYWTGIKWVPIGSGLSGTGLPDTVEVTGCLFITRNPVTGHQVINDFCQPDGRVSGGYITKSDCWKIDMSPIVYYINSREYVIGNTTINIDTADASFARIDMVIVDTFGVVSVVKGTPSATPVTPILPAYTLELATIYIPAAAPCLGITTNVIYDGIADNAAQWGIVTTNPMTVNFTSTVNPYHLAQAAFFSSYTANSYVTFTDAGLDTVTNGEILKMFIYLNGYTPNNFDIEFYNGTTAVSQRMNIGAFINSMDSTAYQNVSIPLSAVKFYSSVFNKLRITFTTSDTSGAKGLYLDYMQLQTGLLPQGKSFVDSVTVIAGSDYYWKNGIATLIGTRGGATVTADNGLTKTVNNIQLGGALTGNTSINGNTRSFTITGANTGLSNTLDLINTSSGGTLTSTTSGGNPAKLEVGGTTNNSIRTVLTLSRASTNNGGPGIGLRIPFLIQRHGVGDQVLQSQIEVSLSDTASNPSGTFQILNGVTGNLLARFTLKSTGGIQFNQYGVGTYTGTATKSLNVDASGNIIEGSVGGGGTVTGGSITWPGTIYTTPTTGSVASGTLTFAPALATQSAKTVLGASTATTPSFITLDSSFITGIHSQGYEDLRYLLQNGSTPLTGNWAAGAFSITANSVAVGSAASSIKFTDASLIRDSINVMAFRNSTSAQSVRFYTTYTDASNYARVQIDASSAYNGLGAGLFNIAAGSGSVANFHFGTLGASSSYIVTNSTRRWQVDANGHLLAVADNTYDIGASAATRPRILYVGTSIINSGSLSYGYLSRASSYTATGSDCVIKVTAAGQAITLPTAVGAQGRIYTIKLTAVGTCTVNTTSSQTIDASTTYSLSAQYKYVTVMSDNANWIIIANN